MKRLLFSILSLGVVSAVAIGATRAYFTDTESVQGNKITTGTLAVEISEVAGTQLPMDITGAFPGWSSTPQIIKVKNVGDLPLKYAWSAVYTGYNEDLFNVLNVKVEDDYLCNGLFVYLKHDGALSALTNVQASIPVPPYFVSSQQACTKFTFSMPTSAGNLYQGKITRFNLVLTATQTDNPGWNEAGTI